MDVDGNAEERQMRKAIAESLREQAGKNSDFDSFLFLFFDQKSKTVWFGLDLKKKEADAKKKNDNKNGKKKNNNNDDDDDEEEVNVDEDDDEQAPRRSKRYCFKKIFFKQKITTSISRQAIAQNRMMARLEVKIKYQTIY